MKKGRFFLTVRLFQDSDTKEVAALVAKILRTTNIKDYTNDYIEKEILRMDADFFVEKAKQTHFYVFIQENKIIGC